MNPLVGRGGMPLMGTPPTPKDAVTATNLQPRNDHFYISPDQPPQKIGELFVPPTGQQCTGTIIAAPPGDPDFAVAKVGDRVVYSGFWPFEIDGKAHIAVMAKHIVGVLPKGVRLVTADKKSEEAQTEDHNIAAAENEGMRAGNA